MWYEKDSTIINAKLIENRDTGIIFEHQFLGPLMPSKRTYKRDFIIERHYSYDIAGIDFHSYSSVLYTKSRFYRKLYNGMSLDLKYEPWNEYDPNAIAVNLLGSKLGYIRRQDTEDVGNILNYSKRYYATLDCSVMGFERVIITFLQEFKDETTLPYQTDFVLMASCSSSTYGKLIKGCIGHAVSFAFSYIKEKIALLTDMNSIIGYINDPFILHQYQRTTMSGFIEDVIYDENSKAITVKMRLLMKKSVINKNYMKSYKALGNFFGSFYDAGSYSISLADLVRILPRKSRSLEAYEPLVKYLKEYHGIELIIE